MIRPTGMQPTILEALPAPGDTPVSAHAMWHRIGQTGSHAGVRFFLSELVAAGMAERSHGPWRGQAIGLYRRTTT